jgi:hypothetical protein
VWLFGNEADFRHFKINVMPKIVGAAFILGGSAAFITGVIRLVLMA